MVVTVKVKGWEKLSRVPIQLEKGVDKEMNKAGDQFMKFVQKSAKLRAPKMTGELANSIKYKKTKKGNWILSVDSPYGIFQELGFKGHLVSSSSSTGNSLGTIGQAYGVPEGVTLLIPSQKGKFFMRNALEMGLVRLPEILNGAAKKAIISIK